MKFCRFITWWPSDSPLRASDPLWRALDPSWRAFGRAGFCLASLCPTLG